MYSIHISIDYSYTVRSFDVGGFHDTTSTIPEQRNGSSTVYSIVYCRRPGTGCASHELWFSFPP